MNRFIAVGLFFLGISLFTGGSARAANEQVTISWHCLPATELAWNGTNEVSTSAHVTANTSYNISNTNVEALAGSVTLTYEWEGATAQDNDPTWATAKYNGASEAMNDKIIRVRAKGVFNYVGVGSDGIFGTSDDTPHKVTEYSTWLEKRLTVFGIESIKAKSAAGSGGYASTATIAAGPYSSAVHRADLEFKIKPGAASQGFSFPLQVTNGHGADVANQKISVSYADGSGSIINSSSINNDGAGSGSIYFNANNATRYGKMSPTNFNGRNTSISSLAGGAVGVTSKWQSTDSWHYPAHFYANEWDSIYTDFNLNGVPLDGHSITFYPVEVTGTYFDFTSLQWDDFTITEDDWQPWALYTRFSSDRSFGTSGSATVTTCSFDAIGGGCSQNTVHGAGCRGGRAFVYQIVYSTILYIVDSVSFRAREEGVYRSGN